MRTSISLLSALWLLPTWWCYLRTHSQPAGPCTGDRQCLACAHSEYEQIHRYLCSIPVTNEQYFLRTNAEMAPHDIPLKKTNRASRNDQNTSLWNTAGRQGARLDSIKFSWLLRDKTGMKYRRKLWSLQALRSSRRDSLWDGSDIHLPTWKSLGQVCVSRQLTCQTQCDWREKLHLSHPLLLSTASWIAPFVLTHHS